MPPIVKNRKLKRVTTEWSSALRVLLMSEDSADIETCKELLELPGCRIQTCSNYVELLLHLEHETFQLVIMFEAKKASSEWRGVVRQAAEASDGTPVLVFKKPDKLTRLSDSMAS